MGQDAEASFQPKLTPAARADLEDIWHYSCSRWSEAQADQFVDDVYRTLQLISRNPGIGRLRREFKVHVRVHVHRGIVILYQAENDSVSVLRLLGGERDWQTILNRLDG